METSVIQYPAVQGDIWHAANPWSGRLMVKPHPLAGSMRWRTVCGMRQVLASDVLFSDLDPKQVRCQNCVDQIRGK